jgi:hypothetical protein
MKTQKKPRMLIQYNIIETFTVDVAVVWAGASRQPERRSQAGLEGLRLG